MMDVVNRMMVQNMIGSTNKAINTAEIMSCKRNLLIHQHLLYRVDRDHIER
jgi:hypothetical protein